jgi:tetratricopeptide (TPR) repeat protein
VSDALRAAAAIVGQQATDDLATELVSLASRTSEVLKTRGDSAAAIQQLALEGSNATIAPRVTAELRPICSGEWATNLDWVCGRWVWRLHQVYLDIRDREQAEAIEHSRGKLLEQWGVTHPEAYEHYQRSAYLLARGLISEAIEEVRTAIRIDPHDPATHCTLGSVLAGIGNRSGNREWVEEGFRECWIAVEFNRSWLLPNVEVGWILIESRRYKEARAHLESIVEVPSGFDANYYQAVGTACSASGDVVAALAAFERAITLDSSDAVSYLAASSCAFQLKDSKKGARYAKEAKRLGSTLAHDAWKAGLFTSQARHF